MISSRQLRAARALAGIDQRALAKAARLSLPTIQRMEASDGVVRRNVESLMKLIAALDRLGIELIDQGAASEGGDRGIRLKKRSSWLSSSCSGATRRCSQLVLPALPWRANAPPPRLSMALRSASRS